MPFDGIGFETTVTPSVVEPWRKALLDAADYIEAHGWCQHRASDGERVCILGAIAMSSDAKIIGASIDSTEQRSPLYLAVRTRLNKYGISGSAWNDTPGRTASEVCQALRQCARS